LVLSSLRSGKLSLFEERPFKGLVEFFDPDVAGGLLEGGMGLLRRGIPGVKDPLLFMMAFWCNRIE
jgi:hypothetical protein